jgi:hypothetical protein
MKPENVAGVILPILLFPFHALPVWGVHITTAS